MTDLPAAADCPRTDGGMPTLGIGTWQNTDPGQCADSVETALEMGYRHVDTAQVYGNEESVGDGIAAADVDREEVFLATKIWTDNLAQDDVLSTAEESLDRLGVDHVDLLYVHWPANQYDPADTLPAFERLREDGRIDRIGVSNFEPRNLDAAREVLDSPVFANQVELHPMLPQEELREYCADADIEVVGYSPLARGDVLENDVLGDVADAHDASAPQVALAWAREKGVTTIPKATSEAHVRDNWASLSVELTDEDVERIDAIDARGRRVDPDFAPW
jgi:2,5-diketo-D-gluconate reductase B